MSALSRSVCRQASSSLRSRRFQAPSLARPAGLLSVSAPHIFSTSRPTTTAKFSTMPTLRDNATAVPAGANKFDPEIVDVAKYVHNYKIDSALAVSFVSDVPSSI